MCGHACVLPNFLELLWLRLSPQKNFRDNWNNVIRGWVTYSSERVELLKEL